MSDFDPVTLEVYWQRLISIAEEQALTLTRTAFSSQAGEMEDISSGVFDTSGRMIAQGVTGTVGVIAALIQGVTEFLKQYPAEALAPGDMLISNDPWLLAGHLNDIAILAPVFRQDRLIGFTATMSHATDIGGKVWSSEGGEIYEEGIWIPPMKLYRQGVLQDDLMRLLEKNVRVPDQVLGDLMAQVTACNVGAEKVIAFCAEERLDSLDEMILFPASHYVTTPERLDAAVRRIEAELAERLGYFESTGRLLEAQRLRMRTTYDLEMLQELGYCNGVENYSAHLDGRGRGEAPFTLLDYFPDDFLTVIDESHVAVPQLHGQYAGDRSRKGTLIEHGFRLPSAADNRPLRFDEVMERVGQVVFLSATPGPYELSVSQRVVEQIVRPTGLVDPEVVVKPTKGQIDDLQQMIRERVAAGARVLVTTLTKKMAEDLTEYLLEMGVRVRYLHSEVDTLARIEILRDLRLGHFDVLVGINLLREGLDLPEVSLVAILDADKEGFLRSETSLVQTIGRAARNVDGQVVMYADVVTDSMRRAIGETSRRRARQQAHNAKHGIRPQTIRKAVTDILALIRPEATSPVPQRQRHERSGRRGVAGALAEGLDVSGDDLPRLIAALTEEMQAASGDLRFEYAARLRDEIAELRRELRDITGVHAVGA